MRILVGAWVIIALLGLAIYQRTVIAEAKGVIRAQVKVILMLCDRACDPAIIAVCESVEPPEEYRP